jgi:copper chaperone CopZ
MVIKTIAVFGMKCSHCKENVENNLRELPGIKDVEVDLQGQEAKITAENIDFERVKSVIENLGYKCQEK